MWMGLRERCNCLYRKIMRKNPVKRDEAPCVCIVFGMSANRVRKSVYNELQDHERNCRHRRATRQSDWCWHSSCQPHSPVGTSPLDGTDTTSRDRQHFPHFLSVFFVSAFLCFSLSPANFLVCFLSPTSLLRQFYSFGLNLPTVRKKPDIKIKLPIQVFVFTQLLTVFHPEEWGTDPSKRLVTTYQTAQNHLSAGTLNIQYHENL